LQHELIGLRCRVVAARNGSHVGIEGRILDETMKMIVIDDKSVPKSGSTFRVWLDEAIVDVDGDAILARPEDRIKKKVKKW